MQPIETKSSDTDLTGAFDRFMQTFEAYKDANDERLSGIERRTADVVSEEKLQRLDRALDDANRTVERLSLKAQRPAIGNGSHSATPDRHHTSAFDTYVRKGDANRLQQIESKALSAGSNPDGGYTVPVEVEAAVNTALRSISPIRAIAGIRQVSASVYRKPFATSGFQAGWVGETAIRPQTTTPA
ncbi:MAG: phage major capsid protein, partial [Hyphomicrobiaceae bacterium]